MTRPPHPTLSTGAPPSVVVVTGMSGAGKSSALKAMEDLGFEAVDNLPLSLLGDLLRLDGPRERPLAVGVDVRTRDFGADSLLGAIDNAGDAGLAVRLVFMDCDEAVLVRRYTETRRRHPLAADRPVADGLGRERVLTAPLKARADHVLDTTRLPPGRLKGMLEAAFGLSAAEGLAVFVTSFAFRQGLPREADLVFDVRFLNNPHYDPDLKPLTGKDPAVAAHVAGDPDYAGFLDGLKAWLAPLLPRFAQEGKSYLTIGVGCTGGRHRSVLVAETLAAWLDELGYAAQVAHRDLDGN